MLSYWDFSYSWKFRLVSPGKLRFLSPRKASCNSHATKTTMHAGCFSVSIIHQTLTWTAGSLCMQFHTRVYRHCSRVCPENWLWNKKSLANTGNRTCHNGIPIWPSTSLATSPPIANEPHYLVSQDPAWTQTWVLTDRIEAMIWCISISTKKKKCTTWKFCQLRQTDRHRQIDKERGWDGARQDDRQNGRWQGGGGREWRGREGPLTCIKSLAPSRM